jgi:putative hydrolases of HD superfamily
MKPHIAKLLSFFNFVLGLKQIQRSGWKFKASVDSPESVADHSFSLCAMAMVFSDLTGLNTERALKMAVLHDLGESIIGDFMPGQISRPIKKDLEQKAMISILKNLPKSLHDEYCQIWKEYLGQRTHLSKLIHNLDKLEMILQARRYMNDGYSKVKLRELIDSANTELSIERRDLISEVLQGLNAASIH